MVRVIWARWSAWIDVGDSLDRILDLPDARGAGLDLDARVARSSRTHSSIGRHPHARLDQGVQVRFNSHLAPPR